MACSRTKKEIDSIKQFQSLMNIEPEPLVLRCKKCSKLRMTREFSDPLLALKGFECNEMGSSCDFPLSVNPSVKETEPHYLPGSFVLATKDEVHYLPGMIDYVPDKHPLFEQVKPTPSGGRALEVYRVSLLNERGKKFAAEYFYVTQISPLMESHFAVMDTEEDEEKFKQCMAMQRGDLRARLYKFSYMAHKYKLENPFPENKRQVTVPNGKPKTPEAKRKSLTPEAEGPEAKKKNILNERVATPDANKKKNLNEKVATPDAKKNNPSEKAKTPIRLTVPIKNPKTEGPAATKYIEEIRRRTGYDINLVLESDSGETSPAKK